MAKTNWGLADWAKSWLGMPYWYGCVCYKCTQDLLNRKAKQYPKHYTQARMPRYKSDIAAGKWAADCIGLAKGYMWWDSARQKTAYAVNGCPDMSANGMLERAKVRGDIKTLPEVPGTMLWMSGHAGVYIGNGWAVEERGFGYGCVKTRVADRPWKKWYRLPGLIYLNADDGSGREKVPFDTANDTAPTHGVKITGDRVNLRKGPGTNYAVASVASKGDMLTEADKDADGWRAVVKDDAVLWVSSKYSEVV